MSDKFFVITDCRTGNEFTSDDLPMLREYGADLAIDAIWLDNGKVEYGQIDVLPSGQWEGDERLALMLGIEPFESEPLAAQDFSALEFEAF